MMGRPEREPARVFGVILLLAVACGGGEEPPSGPDGAEAFRRCGAIDGIELGIVGEPDVRTTEPVRRLVLMGGSVEVDGASRAFVEGAAAGDVLVLRASGSTTSYNGYFFAGVDAEPAPASVTTVRIDDPAMSSSAPVLCRVRTAEAVWLAGGDQWDYVGGWDIALQEMLGSIAERGAAIGGTSAGAVVLGEAAFDARHGSVSSSDALADPLRWEVSVSVSAMGQPELDGWIVDSHFRERDREGRMLAFLARMLPLLGRDTVYGIGLDERASIVIASGEYEVMAAAGRSAWVYRLVGPVGLVAGEALDVDSVLRVQLTDGAAGAWPPSFDGADVVRVVDGVIESGIEPAS